MNELLERIVSRICNASPCEAPVEIKRLAREALFDEKLKEQLLSLAESYGVKLNLSDEIMAYITISKLVNVICSSLI